MAANTTRFWKRPKVWIIGIVSAVTISLLSVFVLTRSFALSPLIANAMGEKLNADVHIDHTRWSWSGIVELEGISIHVKSVEGPASRIAKLDTTIVEVEHWLPWQTLQINSIKTDKVTVRVAESETVAGEFNFSSLVSRSTAAGITEETAQEIALKSDELPTNIDLKVLSLEIGTMNEAQWNIDDTMEFDVELSATSLDTYDVALTNKNHSIDINGHGDLSAPSFTLVINPMQLDDSFFALLPKSATLWCDAIGLHGDVGALEVAWDETDGLRVEVEIDEIEFKLPEVHSLQWVHYENGQISEIQGEPSLRVDKGRITYDGKSAHLEDLRGVLLPPQNSEGSSELPFQATLRVDDLPSVNYFDANQWMETMQRTSPFFAHFQIDGFRSKEEGAGQVDLPRAVAKILQLFHLKDWDVNAELKVSRKKMEGKVELAGSLAIERGSGWYEGFPYPLHDVRALIDIQDEAFVIQSFQAKGSNGSSVSIAGRVGTAGGSVDVDLKLNITDAPLDRALHDAVPKPVATVMDRLLDQDALDEMLLKGLVGEDFELGGFVNMYLSIVHGGKEGDSVRVSGDLDFKDTNVLHNGFPCPISVSACKIRLEPDKLEISDDQPILFLGPGGGYGEIRGTINFDKEGNTQPELIFELVDERITGSMIEAVSISSGDSYGVVDGVLDGLGLNGSLTAIGSVNTTDKGTIEKDILVSIKNSKATPQPKLAKAIHATKPFWPNGFTLTNVGARVTVTNAGVEVEEVIAKFDDGNLIASMDIQGDDYKLHLQGTNWPISENLVYLLPPRASNQLTESWNLLEPSGLLNANVHMSHTDGESELHIEAVPTELGISGNEATTIMTRTHGGIVVVDSSLYLNNLTFDLNQGGNPQGTLQLDGHVKATIENSELDIKGSWKDASASSPLTRAITGLIGGKEAVGYYDSLSPEGSGFVTLLTSGSGDNKNYNVVVIPEELSATFNDRVAHAQFAYEGSGVESRILFDNAGVNFDHLGGTLGEGEFAIEGGISTLGGVLGTLHLDWDGPAGDQSLFAVLPPIVGDTLEALEIGSGTSKVTEGKVGLSGESWSEMEIDFEGDIQLQDVSMNAGIPLSNMFGITNVLGLYEEENLTSLQLRLQLDKMTAVGREISDIDGGLILDPESSRMVFDRVRGISSSGVVTLAGWVAVDDSQEYEVTTLLAGVMLEDDGSIQEESVATFEGEMTGWLSIGGIRGEDGTRHGVGQLRVNNGMFAEVPFSMRAIQLLQLTLPTTDAITTISIDLYIDGEDVVLQKIRLTGDDTSIQGLELSGSGKIEVPSFELDVRLHPRAGWPILRDITGAVGDQLFSIDVTGKLLDPTISVKPLPILSPSD